MNKNLPSLISNIFQSVWQLPSTRRRVFRAATISVAGLASSSFSALAQFRVEVKGVGLTQLPFAIAPFRSEAQSPQKISSIVQADLERSGQFRSALNSGVSLDETSRPDLALWRQRGADSLTTGMFDHFFL